MTDVPSRREIDFLLYEWLDIAALTSRKRFAEHSKDTFDAVLDLNAEIAHSPEIAHSHFATHNKKTDANEPTLRPDGTVEMIDEVEQALDVYSSAGLIAGQFHETVGGMNPAWF